MDGLDLFRRLGIGAKFNFNRFRNDAEKLKIVDVKTSQVKDETDELETTNTASTVASKQHKRKNPDLIEELNSPKRSKLSGLTNDREVEPEEDEENGLLLLGTLKADNKDSKKNKKAKIADLHMRQVNHVRNKNNIHVYGTDVPEPFEAFEQLQERYKVHKQIIENINKFGFQKPTPIQMQAVPVMLEKREIFACAPTGSGKTAAFIIPILHHLKEPRKQGFRALILSPTRELATQTYREFNRFAENRGFRVFCIEKANSATKKFGPKSSKKFDILVTTPNRLVYLLNQEPPAISLSNVEWLIVDESDKLFEEGKQGFRDQLGKIYQACDCPSIRRAMFSATFAYEVQQWCKLNLDNVVFVSIGARNSATDTVDQELLYVGNEHGKLIAVRDIIQKGLQPPMLIFVQSKDRAKELFHELIYDGINVDVIHADRPQKQRDNVVKGFRTGKIWVLICTELMGRGIDFKGVSLVVNFDFPTSAVSYIHRIGRTGRAGRRGKAITFFTEEDSHNLRSIANVIKQAGCPVPDYMLEVKKPKKLILKRLSKTAPKRVSISTIPKKDKEKQRRRRKKSKKSTGTSNSDSDKHTDEQQKEMKENDKQRKEPKKSKQVDSATPTPKKKKRKEGGKEKKITS